MDGRVGVEMKRISVVISIMVLAVLSCSLQISTPVPTTPTTTLLPTVDLLTTPLPTVPTTVSPWKATISKVLVNVRDEPDGDIVTQLRSGESVTILKCAGEWCKISKPVTGWIFKGCLDISSGLGCEAKK